MPAQVFKKSKASKLKTFGQMEKLSKAQKVVIDSKADAILNGTGEKPVEIDLEKDDGSHSMVCTPSAKLNRARSQGAFGKGDGGATSSGVQKGAAGELNFELMMWGISQKPQLAGVWASCHYQGRGHHKVY